MEFIKQHSRRSGFTLIEVLVALVVLSIGLLGLAGLQTASLRANQSSLIRSQASMFAYDIADRMRANRTAATNGAYDIAMNDDAPGNGSVAETDLTEWLANIAATLPAGDASVDVNGAVATIVVQWDDSRAEEGANINNPTPTQFQYETEI